VTSGVFCIHRQVVDCNGDTPVGPGHARLSYIHRGYDAPQGYVGCVSELCCVGVCLCPSHHASVALSHPIARALAMVLSRVSARAIQRLCVCVCVCMHCLLNQTIPCASCTRSPLIVLNKHAYAQICVHIRSGYVIGDVLEGRHKSAGWHNCTIVGKQV